LFAVVSIGVAGRGSSIDYSFKMLVVDALIVIPLLSVVTLTGFSLRGCTVA
jgi:hypothetical protein